MKDKLEDEIFSYILKFGPMGRRNLSIITNSGERAVRNRFKKLKNKNKIRKSILDMM